jgi:hypothetical protein
VIEKRNRRSKSHACRGSGLRGIRKAIFAAMAAAPLFAFAHSASAEPLACSEAPELDKTRLLRRLSLDLRGTIPTVAEYEAAEKGEPIGDAAIDAQLAQAGFASRMRRYHEELFWPNVSNVRLAGVSATMNMPTGSGGYVIASQGKQRTFRGALGATCADVEQTAFDPAFPGEYRPINVTPDSSGVKREGWRMVRPYWDPTTTIKVCAYDAQEGTTGKIGNQTVACNAPEAGNAPTCGCGPSLRYCYGPGSVSSTRILESLREQLGRAVDDVAVRDRPYTDLVLSTKSWIDGRIAFWKTHLAPNLQISLTYNTADPTETVPAKDFTDTNWVEVDRKGLHAGVLTLPAYLLRFQTDRGRANRFRIAFMGEYFVPPAKLEPSPGCSPTSADLTQRCNCQYCHSKLEPLSAHFGLFAEAGTTLMSDQTKFPRTNAACVGRDTGFCGRFYVTSDDAHRPGTLLPFQYADVHPEYMEAIEKGPRKVAQQIIADGTFARTTVRRMFAHLVKREMRVAGDASEEQALLDRLTKGFEASSYSLKWLVREIVKLPAYRRVR